MKNNNSSSNGSDILGLLGILFIALKLSKVINWSWWWVTAPFWGGIIAIITFIAYLMITHIKWNYFSKRFKKK